MAKNTYLDEFRANATEEDWRAAVEDHDNLSNDEFSEKYKFSWSAIQTEATERGFYEPKRKTSTNTKKELILERHPAGIKKKSRSVILEEDVIKRLNSIEEYYGQYNKTSILNQLLKDALNTYGF